MNPALQIMLTGRASAVAPKTYVEDVFSAYTYNGTGVSGNAVSNGIDLAGKGGLVVIKQRTDVPAATPFFWMDTVRGGTSSLASNSTAAAVNPGSINLTFDSSGFTNNSTGANQNGGSSTYGSWTFRKAPKFFDVVTYTGDASGFAKVVSHGLTTTVGFVMIKRTDAASNWWVAARNSDGTYSTSNDETTTPFGVNSTNAAVLLSATQVSIFPSASTFKPAIVAQGTAANVNGGTYVAYLFAHDTSADGLIQCGSFTVSGNVADVTLGWEPQFLLIKKASAAGNWGIKDVARGGMTATAAGDPDAILWADSSSAELSSGNWREKINATGFGVTDMVDATFIYMAIRRPMKTPTSGTQVYNAVSRAGTSGAAAVTGIGFAPDLVISKGKTATSRPLFTDRLRGKALDLWSSETNQETADATALTSFDMDGFSVGIGDNGYNNGLGNTFINWCFKRAPGFFDEVCFTGTGSAITMSHNLGVAPELVIFKSRSGISAWPAYTEFTPTTMTRVYLNATSSRANATYAAFGSISSQPTATAIAVTTGTTEINSSGVTEVAYLFATLAGVSKVGSYVGNGTSQTINCGFAAGARFILIRRTDNTGDWYVWDTVRGIVSGNDPHLSMNTTATDVTTDNSIDLDSSGFIVNQLAATNINVNGASYIFLAIA